MKARLLALGTNLLGAALINSFSWVFYIFGAFLVYTGIKMAIPSKEEAEVDPEHNVAVRLFRHRQTLAARLE
mgnify:CR=1 FL=1